MLSLFGGNVEERERERERLDLMTKNIVCFFKEAKRNFETNKYIYIYDSNINIHQSDGDTSGRCCLCILRQFLVRFTFLYVYLVVIYVLGICLIFQCFNGITDNFFSSSSSFSLLLNGILLI